MMTFVNDDQSVVLHEGFYTVLSQTRLDEGYIYNSMQGIACRIKATYRGENLPAATFLWFFWFLTVNVKKLRKTFVPLCKQGLGVNKNECVYFLACNNCGGCNGFSKSSSGM